MNVSVFKVSALPQAIRDAGRFVRWKEVGDRNGKVRKTPVNSSGRPVGYNDPAAGVDLDEAHKLFLHDSKKKLGITLLDGLAVKVDGEQQWLWILDFDGLADFGTESLDLGVPEFLERFPSYAERLINERVEGCHEA